jgi:hypothetical protein
MFQNRSDRGAAILLATYVEAALQQAIEGFLHVRDKQRKALFGISSPIGTLANKCRIAFALDIIGPETFSNLDYIREIRNAFAHSKIHVSFKTKEVRDVCGLFVIPEDETPWPYVARTSTARQIFQSVSYITSTNLVLMHGNALAPGVHRLDRENWSLYNRAMGRPFPILPTQELIVRRKSLP